MPSALELFGRHFCHAHDIEPSLLFDVRWIDPHQLLSERRLDVVPKLRLAAASDLQRPRRVDEYGQSLFAVTKGALQEPGQPKKQGVAAYASDFFELIRSMESSGFDSKAGVLPVVECDGHFVLLDGGHRLAASIALGLSEVPVSIVSSSQWLPDFTAERFLKSGTPCNLVEMWVSALLQLTNHAALVLWPKSYERIGEIESLLQASGLRTSYRVSRRVNSDTLRHVVTEAYAAQQHRWLGNASNAYRGAVPKAKAVSRRGTDTQALTVFFLRGQDEAFSEALALKHLARETWAQGGENGNDLVHATDNSQETRRIGNAILGQANEAFLRDARPYRFGRFARHAYQLRKHLDDHGLEASEVVFVGSTPLGAFGVRPPADFDFLTANEAHKRTLEELQTCESHNHVASDYGLAGSGRLQVEELAALPTFSFAGLRFADISIAFSAATRRRERTRHLDAVALTPLLRGEAIGIRHRLSWLKLRARRLPLLVVRYASRFVWRNSVKGRRFLRQMPYLENFVKKTIKPIIDWLNFR